jgi:hypothetical protein
MKKKKYPSQMSNKELDKLAKECEGEFLFEKTRPLTPKERKRWMELRGARHLKKKKS